MFTPTKRPRYFNEFSNLDPGPWTARTEIHSESLTELSRNNVWDDSSRDSETQSESVTEWPHITTKKLRLVANLKDNLTSSAA